MVKKLSGTHLAITLCLLLVYIITMRGTVQSIWYADEQLTNDMANICSLYQSGSVYLGRNGEIHLLWLNDKLTPNFAEIYHLVLKDGQANNSTRITYDSTKSTDPGLVEDSSGNLHIVWRDDRKGGRILYKKRTGKKWGNIVFVCDSQLKPDNPTICISSNDEIHLVYEGRTGSGKRLFYQKLKKDSWSKRVQLTKTKRSENPHMCVDKFNNLHLVFEDFRDGNKEIYYKKHKQGKWFSSTRLTIDKANSNYPKVAADKKGRIHVVWDDSRDGNREIYYRQKKGKNWQSEIRLTNDKGTSGKPYVALDNDNTIHVVWMDTMDSGKKHSTWNFEIYHKASDGINWTTFKRLTKDNSYSFDPIIVVDKKNNLNVFWKDNRTKKNEIFYKRYLYEPGKKLVFGKQINPASSKNTPVLPEVADTATPVPPKDTVTPVPTKKAAKAKKPLWTPYVHTPETRKPTIRPTPTKRQVVVGTPTMTATYTNTLLPTNTLAPTSTATLTPTANWVATLKAARMKRKTPKSGTGSPNTVPYYYRPAFPPTRTWTPTTKTAETSTDSVESQSIISETPGETSVSSMETEVAMPPDTPTTTQDDSAQSEFEMYSTRTELTPSQEASTPAVTDESPVSMSKFTFTPTLTPSFTSTRQFTRTPTATITHTPVHTHTRTHTLTMTQKATSTYTPAESPSATATFTNTKVPPPTVGPYKMVFYLHHSLELNTWGDGWSHGMVQPRGEYMSEEAPKQTAPSHVALEILKSYYCYSRPPITGKFSPGDYLIELWVGNPNGPINGLLQLRLELTDEKGNPIVDLGMNFLSCRTSKKGPALFKSEAFRYNDVLSIDKCRFKITITPIDSLDLIPFIYWDSYNKGASRLLPPVFSPPSRKR